MKARRRRFELQSQPGLRATCSQADRAAATGRCGRAQGRGKDQLWRRPHTTVPAREERGRPSRRAGGSMCGCRYWASRHGRRRAPERFTQARPLHGAPRSRSHLIRRARSVHSCHHHQNRFHSHRVSRVVLSNTHLRRRATGDRSAPYGLHNGEPPPLPTNRKMPSAPNVPALLDTPHSTSLQYLGGGEGEPLG